ncbi:solute carrier family 12 [Trichuris trichiura]|uniref:Solute carrier family 12 n=1 Tax=Trichuris trichiura TaxID=36087 RepID=A0A077YXW4_TRITR|nr:solute carrier family 12 [Trichuris trichiura]
MQDGDNESLSVGGLPRNQSRFKVNKVEGEEENGAILVSQNETPRPRQVQFVVDMDEDDARAADTAQHPTVTYKTSNFKSFRNVETVERVPIVDYYRDVMSIEGAIATRPSLAELHEEHYANDAKNFETFKLLDTPSPSLKPDKAGSGRLRLGWIQGVLVRVVLSILGTILFLRVSWMTAHAGIGCSILIVLCSSAVSVITCLSMCAICTNGEIKGGGAYFMISRSLGPEFGGSIGLAFAFANVVAAAFCSVGFAETLRDLLKEHGLIFIDGELNDIRVIGILTMVLILAIAVVGVSFESKAQWVMLVVLTVSLVDFLVGTLLPPDEVQQSRGVTGYSTETFLTNFWPDWYGETFFSVFSVFYPATTGIMAGANISGDLDNPATAIPKGTLLGIAVTSLIYAGTVIVTGATVIRQASGEISDAVNGSISACAQNGTCSFGIMNYYQTLELLGAWGPLVTAGIFAATLSSALAGFVSGPKLLQALGKDKLFPFVAWFSFPYGRNREPRRAYVLAFFLGLAIVSIGEINLIAPIIANIFLVCYALINYAVFDASFAGSPGFRPSFRYYNQWVALIGALLCVAIMFVLSWWKALLTFLLTGALYVYIHHRNPDVNWGSSGQAHSYKSALHSTLKLASTEEHVKNYRPQLLLLTGNPVSRPSLVDFGASITKDVCLLVCGHVLLSSLPFKRQQMQKLIEEIYQWFTKRKVKSFYTFVVSDSLHTGVRSLLQSVGVGKLRPNVVLMGFKNDWKESTPEQVEDYFKVIHTVFDNYCGLAILRLQNGLDFSDRIAKCDLMGSDASKSASNVAELSPPAAPTAIDHPVAAGNFISPEESQTVLREDSYMTYGSKESSELPKTEAEETEEILEYLSEEPPAPSGTEPQDSFIPSVFKDVKTRHLSSDQRQLMYDINRFQTRLKHAVIDVYWLFDDGGLGLLIPHLLTLPQSFLRNAKLRVFTVATSRSQLEREQRSMAALLSRFRLDYSDVIVIPDLTKRPSNSLIEEFQEFIFSRRAETSAEETGDRSISSDVFITATEYDTLKPKTYRQLRIKELLHEHSFGAQLIVLTLPIPRKSVISASLYLSWLDFVSKDMPCPVLYLRGNQESVLTFYS